MERLLLTITSLLCAFTFYAQSSSSIEICGDNTDDDIMIIKNNNYARYAAYGASDNSANAIPCFVGFKSRGTVASPTTLLGQDRISGLYGGMYVNGQYRVSAAVEMFAGDNPGSNSYPAFIRFGTTANNSVSRVERMRISEEGHIGIGTSDPSSKLEVADGDVYISDINNGVIMKSPNGTCWRYQADNSGALVGAAIVCPN